MVRPLDLAHSKVLFAPRNANCLSKLNKFDAFLCIRIGVQRSKSRLGKVSWFTEQDTATASQASPTLHSTLPRSAGNKLDISKNKQSGCQRHTSPSKQRSVAKAELLRFIIQKPYHKSSSGIKHCVILFY